MFYLHTVPFWLKWFFPSGLLWHQPVDEPHVFLTFDDGPHESATVFVLEQLAQYRVKGTFFCIGKNIRRHPELFDRILAEGHSTGNHTMNHVNGGRVEKDHYLEEVRATQLLTKTNLFRPPYGRINKKQARAIAREFPGMNIVMWSVLAGDFDRETTPEKIIRAIKKHTRPGSIIVFHDSAKALPLLQQTLPHILEWLKGKGYRSQPLPFGPA